MRNLFTFPVNIAPMLGPQPFGLPQNWRNCWRDADLSERAWKLARLKLAPPRKLALL
jgi:hypothetical protein